MTGVSQCRDDDDCIDTQFCYHVSHLCVDYMLCSRYNRQNGTKKVKDPAQCGPCLPGYSAGKPEDDQYLCGRSNPRNISGVYPWQYAAIILMTMGFFSILFAIGFLLHSKKRLSTIDNESMQGTELRNASTKPSAPLESSPFIIREVVSYPEQFDNNKNLKDKDNLVRAMGFHPPRWVRVDPNYGNDSASDNSMRPEVPINIQLNMTPEELGVEVPDGTIITTLPIEQIDNNVNTILVQTNPSTSNATENNNNNDDNNSNNSNSSSPEPSHSQGNRERGRTSNILISQKVSMNVNVFNSDG